MPNPAKPVSNDPRRPPSRFAWVIPAFVWGVWGLATVGVFGFVGTAGRDVPYEDDFEMIGVCTGAPLSPAWLWEFWNEHRIPVPKLALYSLGKLTHCDFRAGMYFNALALAILSGALIVVAAKLRGRTSLADVAFPLALLHWGHAWVLLWSFEIQFVLSTIFGSVILLLMISRRHALGLGATLGVGAMLLLLPLTGANGVALVPALALWLGYTGIVQWRSGEPAGKAIGLAAVALAVAGFLLVGFYFLGFDKARLRPGVEVFPGYLAAGMTTVQVLCMSFGPGVRTIWPVSGVLVVGVLLLGTGLLVRTWWRQPQEHFRAVGLFFFLGAIVSLGLGVGWGRSVANWYNPQPGGGGFSEPYAVFMAPLVSGLFLAGVLSGSRLGSWLQWALALVLVVMFPLNQRNGVDTADYFHSMMDPFLEDLTGGTPPYLLADRHAPYLLPYRPKADFVNYLQRLQHAGAGPYRLLAKDPPPRELAVPAIPDEMIFDLQHEPFVYAIRLTYSHKAPTSAKPDFELFWRTSDQEEFNSFTPDARTVKAFSSKKIVTVPIYDRVGQIKICPISKPHCFRIQELMVREPKTEGAGLPEK